MAPERGIEKTSSNGAQPDLTHVFDEVHQLRREQAPKIQPDGSKLYSLKLDHGSGKHAGPDATVLVPKNFDPSKPVHVVVYDHGWGDTATSALKTSNLIDQMKGAQPNTVLVVPEWQQIPGSGLDSKNKPIGGLQGDFKQQNQFEGMIQDVFNKVPELKQDKFGAKGSPDVMKGAISQSTLDKIQDVSIVSHSAGFNAVNSELMQNPDLVGKVNNVTMLDSDYNHKGLQSWMEGNMDAFKNGEKHLTVIVGPTTDSEKYNGVFQKWAHDHLPTLTLTEDSAHPDQDAAPADLNRTPVVFRKTSLPHMTIPERYLAIEMQAERDRSTAN